MELKGSRTEANLMAAFAGESQARTKYTFYESLAKKAGYEQIANIFKTTADNEKEHAKLWFKYLRGGEMPDLKGALEDAAGGEHYEWSEMYKEFAEVALEEGFKEISAVMKMVATIEKEHEERYRKLIKNLDENKVFIKDNEVMWVCRNCGYVHFAKEAPGLCPACRHPKAYFEVKAENY